MAHVPLRLPAYPLTVAVPSSLQLQARQSTCNTATNRQCWTSSFNVNTDYEAHTPLTGVTRSYTLTLTEHNNWIGGDGHAKVKAMLVNGPAITAGNTSIHYHGLRQLYTNTQDGVSGVTECPIPPGSSKTYSFIAHQYGTAWYHSHYSAQYANGALGPIVIHGPASANYDIDLGPLMISDWYYPAANQILAHINNPNTPYIPGFPGSPPPSDNVLFNGKNINPTGSGGSRARFTLTPGKKHLLRLINPSVQNAFTLTLVGHTFTIIATDFVPITPKTVTSLFIGIGQRYDVIITANQPTANYWFNATFSATPCGQSANPFPAAIFSYTGASSTTSPTSRGTAPPDSRCSDSHAYTPVVARSAPNVASFSPSSANTLNTNVVIDTTSSAAPHVYWTVNDHPMRVSWNHPTLEYVQNSTVSAMAPATNLITVPSAPNTYTFVLIQNNFSIPHPIHLHGHDVLILGSSPALSNPIGDNTGLRAFNPATDAALLKGSNPARRDTTMLPAWGWLAVAYQTNNPGAWLFHCHIAWHVSQGLSVQFLEQQGAISSVMDLNGLKGNCGRWRAYYPAEDPFDQDDSGI
ncbi:Cupredoxin [Bombardia bombarda]|uniref:laccase n=1 Tax=Bombardia bombarda TaxID=252184 RepID=A0AA40C5N1_9PEZI|nr:Cupredoxin [Bombardia bombarda]